jgi:hypothetical protein
MGRPSSASSQRAVFIFDTCAVPLIKIRANTSEFCGFKRVFKASGQS